MNVGRVVVQRGFVREPPFNVQASSEWTFWISVASMMQTAALLLVFAAG